VNVTESQLRERYRNASDEELVDLAQQGSSEFTDTAWGALQEEMSRRGLSLSRSRKTQRTAKSRLPRRSRSLPLGRWGEVLAQGSSGRFKELSDGDVPAFVEQATGPPGELVKQETAQIAGIVFTGRGSEYFRIWIVNLLLIVLTVGIYSAWAKVRTAKYFRQNTCLDGHVFDYHGNPVAILRGRLIALALLAAYTWAFQFSNAAGLWTVVTLCVVGPWLFLRAQQFSLANTSFRGLRFGFRARAGEAYSALLPVLVLWLSPVVATALMIDKRWLFGAPTVALPWMHHRLKAFQRRNATYGHREFTFSPAVLRFYGVYAKGLPFVLVGGLLAREAIGVLSAWRRASGQTVSSPTVETVIYGAIAGLFIYVIVWPYYAARLQELVWTRTRLGDIRFHTEIQALPLFLVLKNTMLTVLTCGLYWPWAAVALARYRIECMRVESDVPLSSLTAGLQAAPVSAAGAGAADAFGLDIGL
jgi:uncharacterized membrane protein YjgN (DUF898 family)